MQTRLAHRNRSHGCEIQRLIAIVMKIIKARIYTLRIPFNFSFGHSLKDRDYSDSIVVELSTDTGETGFGEGVARAYVTGETVKESISHIKSTLLPSVLNKPLQALFADTHSNKVLSRINDLLPSTGNTDTITWNASRCAVELALIDILLKVQQKSLGELLPPSSRTVTYSGVISSGSTEETIKFARIAKQAEIKQVKIKVGNPNDLERVKVVRDILGPSVSIRLDANGAFSAQEALRFIANVEVYHIDSIEQPVKSGGISELAEVKASSSIPVMVDESLVTLEDARALIENDACDYFNLRVSKCGGIYKTLTIADLAEKNGIKCQLGCQVGETAILSAAGRHMAYHLPNILFLEGSYGKLLLSEDVARDDIAFGKGGEAPVLKGYGLGVEVDRSILEKYSEEIICV